MNKPTAGFTIVELLIAIVIVSILASLSVVAYNGITAKSRDSLIAAKVRGVVNMVETYGAANDGKVPQADWACIGEPDDFPAENGYTAEWCHQPYQEPPIPNGSDHPINATVNAKFKTIVGQMPNSRIPEVDLGGGTKYRGFMYDSSAVQNSGKPVVQYLVTGIRSACPIGVVSWTGANYTVCEYRFQSVVSETGN